MHQQPSINPNASFSLLDIASEPRTSILQKFKHHSIDPKPWYFHPSIHPSNGMEWNGTRDQDDDDWLILTRLNVLDLDLHFQSFSI